MRAQLPGILATKKEAENGPPGTVGRMSPVSAKDVDGLWGRPVRGTESEGVRGAHTGAWLTLGCGAEAHLGQARARHRLESDWTRVIPMSK